MILLSWYQWKRDRLRGHIWLKGLHEDATEHMGVVVAGLDKKGSCGGRGSIVCGAPPAGVVGSLTTLQKVEQTLTSTTRKRGRKEKLLPEIGHIAIDISKEAEDRWRILKLTGASIVDESNVLAEIRRSKRIQLLEEPEP